MNIVYLIGNGFDLNLGMETSYDDFCKYYINLPKNDLDIVERLKEKIKENIKSWSAFESKLGKFLDNTVGEQDAVELHRHLIDHLKEFIEREENKCIFDKTQKDIFYEYLSKPYTDNDRLLFTDLKKVENFMLDRKHGEWDVKIITFNYTRSIEKMLDVGIVIGTHSYGRRVILSEIEHIHGFTNKRLILGVNDVSQIASDVLRTETRVIERYIKFNCNNSGYNEGHDEKCQRWIKNADLVCLFGLSFGDTDRRWWNMVCDVIQKKNGIIREKENGKVIIFKHWLGDLPDDNHGNDMNDLKEDVKNEFLFNTTVSEDLKKIIKKDMYVVFNTKMFNFGKLKKHIETNTESV
jgi:hypothetical protein